MDPNSTTSSNNQIEESGDLLLESQRRSLRDLCTSVEAATRRFLNWLAENVPPTAWVTIGLTILSLCGLAYFNGSERRKRISCEEDYYSCEKISTQTSQEYNENATQMTMEMSSARATIDNFVPTVIVTRIVEVEIEKIVTVTATVEPTPTLSNEEDYRILPSPTLDPLLPIGNCDDNPRPCIEYEASSWTWIGETYFGHGERCRWVEVADLNRSPNGKYNIPMPDGLAILIPPVQPRGTYNPRFFDGESYIPIPLCTNTTTKPCYVLIEDRVSGIARKIFDDIADRPEVFGYSTYLIAKTLRENNRDSLCLSLDLDAEITLEGGEKIVIPSELD
ncbi:MAG: hypothetical protein GTO18_15235 [Anaerolineales bacterium]|nr:hypothetical protein [Anaerolineales bacterium]